MNGRKKITILQKRKGRSGNPMREKSSNPSKNVHVINTKMNTRISLQSKNDTPIFGSLDRLDGTRNTRENMRATFMRIIKILSMTPIKTIKNDSRSMDKSTSTSNLNIKMWDRLPTTISPDIRIIRNIIAHTYPEHHLDPKKDARERRQKEGKDQEHSQDKN